MPLFRKAQRIPKCYRSRSVTRVPISGNQAQTDSSSSMTINERLNQLSADRCFGFRGHVFRRDAEVLVAGRAGSASTVRAHAHEATVAADVMIPALANAGFTGHAGCDLRRQHAVLIRFVLR